MMECATFRSPFGTGWIGRRDGAITEIHLDGRPPAGSRKASIPLARKIERYFAGHAVRFDERIELPPGRGFARRVYRAVRSIPRGRTRSYGDIATRAGSPGAARAVGQLMKRNPVCLIIPCHRVVASDGGLGGFTGGLDRKRHLLSLERSALSSR